VLGRQLGHAISTALSRANPVNHRTKDVAAALAGWFDTAAPGAMPWLRAQTRWQVLAAETLLDRAHPDHVRFVWPLLARWARPADTAAAVDELREIGGWIGRDRRARRLQDLARQLAPIPEVLDNDETIRTVGADAAALDLAILVVPTCGDDDSEEPVLTTKGVLRVARRFTSDLLVDRRNRLTDGRLALAAMIGDETNARRAHLGLIELAASVCHTTDPACGGCPLQSRCRYPATIRREPADQSLSPSDAATSGA
jgi:DNA (cytosine-5)-methyltransferase 1